MYMLDTDTASYAIRGTSKQLDRHISAARRQPLCISVITRAELLTGIALKPEATTLARVVDQFLAAIPCLPWDDAAAACFAQLVAELQRAGQPLGTMDTMIAAHALATDAVLITHNTRHFGRIPGLALQDWAGPARL